MFSSIHNSGNVQQWKESIREKNWLQIIWFRALTSYRFNSLINLEMRIEIMFMNEPKLRDLGHQFVNFNTFLVFFQPK